MCGLRILLLSLALCLAVSQDILEMKSVCGADCSLKCTAKSKPGVQYRMLRWYKAGELPSAGLRGLLSKNLSSGTIRWYAGVERHVEFLDDSGDIFLPNVTYSDSGIYVCHLAAPVGEQNQESKVHLILRGCPESPSDKVLTDAYSVIFATLLLMTSLLIFLWSYHILRKILKDRNKPTKKETLLTTLPKPLEDMDVPRIYTLGPKWTKPHQTHAYV